MKILLPLATFLIPVFSLEPSSKESDVTYTSYQYRIECHSKEPIQIPKDIIEIQSIIKRAIETNTNVKVVGSRHSVTDTICTDGIPIKLENFNQVKINNNQNGNNNNNNNNNKITATIGAGIELIDALDILNEKGYTIQHIPAFGGITVGGAIGLGAHGSSLVHRNTLSEYIVGLTVIDGQGKIKKITDKDEEFNAFRVNFGLLGVIVDVTLEIVPQFKMEMENYKVPEDYLLKNSSQLIDQIRKHDWFQFWWFPSSSGLVLSKGNHVPVNTTGDASANLMPTATPFAAIATKVIFETLQLTSNNYWGMSVMQKSTENTLYKKVMGKDPIFIDEDGKFVNPAVGYGYKLMTNRCNPCAWEMLPDNKNAFHPEEYSIALPLSELPAVVADIKQLINENPTAFPLVGLFFRFSRPTRGLFSISHGEETFHIDWSSAIRRNYLHDSPYGLSVMQALTQLLVDKHNGRPHWGKNGLHYFSHDIISKRYPAESFTKFKKVVEKYDPKRIFSNRFGDRILGDTVQVSVVPKKVTRCALQEYCVCQKDSDCSENQICSEIMGYPVCKTKSTSFKFDFSLLNLQSFISKPLIFNLF